VPRCYTVAEANATLPLVRRIVEDVVAAYARWRRLVDEFEVASVRNRADRPDPRAAALQREAQAVAREIDSFALELRALDVELRAFDVGLVEFSGIIGGRPGRLAWRLGEPGVQPARDRGRHAA